MTDNKVRGQRTDGVLQSTRAHVSIHQHLLRLVRDGRIMWRADIGLSGGFAPVGGGRFPPGDALVALYELRNAHYIGVEAESGRIFITRLGLALLLPRNDLHRRKAS